MSKIRLKDFIAKTHIPAEVAIDIAGDNKLKLEIDEDGFLLLPTDEESLGYVLSFFTNPRDQDRSRGKHLQIAEQIIRTEITGIIENAIKELTKAS